MRKLRWLGIALLVMIAPAVWVFLTTWWTLAGYSNADTHAREQFLSELQYTQARTNTWGPLEQLIPRNRSEPPKVVFDWAFRKKSLLEEIEPCPGNGNRVDLITPDTAHSHNIDEATRELELAVARHKWYRVYQFNGQLHADRFENWELAALDACFRATPFHSFCSGLLRERGLESEAIAERLEEIHAIQLHGGERCWAIPQFEVLDTDTD